MVLPIKPVRTRSALVGKAYSAAGQAAACLHTMFLLQTYQVELLGDDDEVVVRMQFANSIGPQICLSGLWLHLVANISRWVLQTKFRSRPLRFMGVFSIEVAPQQVLVMEQEVKALLEKGAIEYVPHSNRKTGLYSRYFIIPKKDGGLCPILDLRVLNNSVMQLKFKILTLRQIVPQIRSEDWFGTIDLKDAYFHKSILPYHRKFLRFGIALSPRTFKKYVNATLVPLPLQGIHIMNCIDGWLILAQSHQLAVRHQDVILADMKELGLRLNAKKSVLSPLQRTTFLSVAWDSTSMQTRPSPVHIESILMAVKSKKLG